MSRPSSAAPVIRKPREWPKLCADSVVRNILSGAQTQDRRPLVFSRRWVQLPANTPVPTEWRLYVDGGGCIRDEHGDSIRVVPVPDDLLWVRECWAPTPGAQAALAAACGSASTAREMERRHQIAPCWLYRADPGRGSLGDVRWRPSIHMPRLACRLVLPVTRVWVERVQEISEKDARAEGARCAADELQALGHLRGADAARSLPSGRLWSAHRAFRWLWEHLYPGSWGRNDWVLCVEWEKPVAVMEVRP